MGRATDSTWFGMYANLINAQDWYIKNNRTTGEVTVKVRAAGGLGDLYFMLDHDPHNITRSYHTIVGFPVATPQWALGWHHSK
jgi:alpha-glucosidase (family GH31 glycosyl hydrolase)